MTQAILALIFGIIILAISADRFVAGAAVSAKLLGIPPLLVGMLVIGFGSSAPEFVVSVIAASEGNAGLALGNVLGSNISNIALILGITALIKPITVKSSVLRKELPILIFITMITTVLLTVDRTLGRADAAIAAVRHNEHDLALGNVIGSNIFNTTIVIGAAGAIVSTPIDPAMISRDIPIMIGFTFMLFLTCYSLGSQTPRINRGEALVLLSCYFCYNALLISQMI